MLSQPYCSHNLRILEKHLLPETQKWVWRVTGSLQTSPYARRSLSPFGPAGLERRGRERAYCSVTRNRDPNTTLPFSMSVEGMGPFWPRRKRPPLRGLRDLSPADTRPDAVANSDGSDGEPLSLQGRSPPAARRKAGLRAVLYLVPCDA